MTIRQLSPKGVRSSADHLRRQDAAYGRVQVGSAFVRYDVRPFETVKHEGKVAA